MDTGFEGWFDLLRQEDLYADKDFLKSAMEVAYKAGFSIGYLDASRDAEEHIAATYPNT